MSNLVSSPTHWLGKQHDKHSPFVAKVFAAKYGGVSVETVEMWKTLRITFDPKPVENISRLLLIAIFTGGRQYSVADLGCKIWQRFCGNCGKHYGSLLIRNLWKTFGLTFGPNLFTATFGGSVFHRYASFCILRSTQVSARSVCGHFWPQSLQVGDNIPSPLLAAIF